MPWFDFWECFAQNEIMRKEQGFTLIELILVMALVGILAVVGLGAYTQATMKSRDTQRKNDLNQIAKGLEAFNNDIGRYPMIDAFGEMTCPQDESTEISCSGDIFAYIDGAKATYMSDVPVDQKNGWEYVYVPSDGFDAFSLYAALENSEDRDVVTLDGVTSDWDISCGDVECNYKLTELGLVRTK